MSDYADTSLVVSYLTPDAKSQDAKALFLRTRSLVFVTDWTRFEFENALALRRFRGEATEADVRAWLSEYDVELAQGFFEHASFDYFKVLARARMLTAAHSHKLGTRSFDVFHVATALELGATRFLTFDQRQVSLARALGLNAIT